MSLLKQGTIKEQKHAENVICSLSIARAIIKVSGHQCRWLAGGYDLEIGHF